MREATRAAALALAAVVQEFSIPGSFRPADPGDLAAVKQQLDLPSDVLDWYLVASPQNISVPTPGNYPRLYGLSELGDAQRGYRSDAITGEVLTSWNPTWIVIGGEGPYPLIVRTANSQDPAVYYGRSEGRAWRLTTLSTNVEGFLLGVADYLRLYVRGYSGEVLDDDGMIKQSFLTDFVRALNQRASTEHRGEEWLKGWLGY